ncbi:hypothetical protein M3557_04935 [Bhargavaea ginsengi]|uniref:hypothetical protein n=1 Tax=Bhargavaea ginsengi TaxID=426757 RepID=UPI00203C9393|nr:hypothetical protein [Bhargavaea ginsengi]MCM3087252.1 hypothetical protein [Bhargavaea ginsengi]
MQRKWKHATLSATAILLLAACGTAEEADQPEEDTQMVQEEEANQNGDAVEETETEDGQPAEEESPEEADSAEKPAEDEESAEESSPGEQAEQRGPERELTYQSGGEQQTSQAKLTESDVMDFSLYVLDGYQLTSEEPNKDVLYWNEDEQVFMRIETFGTDADYAMLTEQMIGSLEFDGGEAKDVSDEYNLAEADGIEELVLRQLENGEGLTTGAVFKKDGMTVRLTVFDKPEADQTDALLSMGATIGQK